MSVWKNFAARMHNWWEFGTFSLPEETQTPPSVPHNYVAEVDHFLKSNPKALECLQQWKEIESAYRKLLALPSEEQYQHGLTGYHFFQKLYPMNRSGVTIELFRNINQGNLNKMCREWLGMKSEELDKTADKVKLSRLIVALVGPELITARAYISGLCGRATRALEESRYEDALSLQNEAIKIETELRDNFIQRFQKELGIELTSITTLQVLWIGSGATGVESQPGCKSLVDGLRNKIENFKTSKGSKSAPSKGNAIGKMTPFVGR